MKNAILVAALALLSTTLIPTAALANNYCAKYEKYPARIDAISIVAAKLQYSVEELCGLERLADIHVADTTKYDKKGEPVALDWVTLHYNEYSCQYFIRKDNRATFAQNCYSTF